MHPRRLLLATTAAVVALTVGIASGAGTGVRTANTATTASAPAPAAGQLADFPPLDGLKLGARDLVGPGGGLRWEPSTGRQFASAYTYIGPPDTKATHGPGGSSDYAASARYFVAAARAAKVQPVLTWFAANSNVHGNGVAAACSTRCSEGDTARRNLDHLGDADFERDYFTTLESVLAAVAPSSPVGSATPVLLHVEPDLSGYAQELSLDRDRCGDDCLPNTPGETPAGLHAAVGSTGLPELAGLPDTVVGFYSAVLRLRDSLAPGVDLGFHISGWAASTAPPSGSGARVNDVDSSTGYVNAAALSGRVAGFATAAALGQVPAGSRGWQDIFTDVLDHDAAYAQLRQGQSQYWWDTDNAVQPTFSRWQAFASGLHARTGLPLVLWQVPLGNQVFLTEDNTSGHYQDNRAEYFLRHPSMLTSAGVGMMIFGGGHATDSNTWDRTGDGVTNPGATCSTMGSSRGTRRCTSVAATSADDDGGFLRAAAAQDLPPVS